MEYRIASFNLKKFGLNAWKTRDLAKLAEIIVSENLDVVALQEIFSEGKGIFSEKNDVNSLIKELAKYELYEWDYCFDTPKDTSDLSIVKDTNRGEGYAYLWNKKRFKLVEYSQLGTVRQFEPRIINSLSNDVNADCSIFARTPYYIRLQPKYGGFFELRLINIHMYWGENSIPGDERIKRRRDEFELLTQCVYPGISMKRYGNFRFPYTIAMGDYNLNLSLPSGEVENTKAVILSNVYSCNMCGKTINILTDQKDLTTLKNDEGYANNYDHFTYSSELSPFLGVSIEAIDAVRKYCGGDFSYYREKISDHLPILMKINI